MRPLDQLMLNSFLSGAVMLGYCAIGYFFQRFWKKTGDKLFAFFAAAFWVLACERIILLVTDPEHEQRFYVYLVRLFAFLLILYAIYDKNRPAKA